LLTHPNKFPFVLAKAVIFDGSRGVIFTRTFTLTVRLPGEKIIPLYPARNGINFPYFQLARRSFKFPSQLINQCNFSQLAQILYEERLFCRAAPLGTPEQTNIQEQAAKYPEKANTVL